MKYRKISQQLAKELIDSNKDVIIIDLRSANEYKMEHLKGAISLPRFDIEKNIGKYVRDKFALIFVYCAGGVHSKTYVEQLYKSGYRNVYDIGGINEWPYDTYRA